MSVFGGPDIVTDGLVLHLDAANRKSYPLSGSTIYDLSGNGNNGTINGATFNTDYGGFFNFNGHSITTTNTFAFNQSGRFSVEFFIKIISHTDKAAAAAGIIGKGHYSSNGWDIWLRNNHQIAFETSGDPTRQGLNYLETSPLTLNVWYHFVATYNNGSKVIYLNGSQVGTQTYSGPGDFDNTNPLWIGMRYNDSYRSLRGSLTSIKIYDLDLSADEIRQNYNALKGRYGLT